MTNPAPTSPAALTGLLAKLRERCAEMAEDTIVAEYEGVDCYGDKAAARIRTIELDGAVREFLRDQHADAVDSLTRPAGVDELMAAVEEYRDNCCDRSRRTTSVTRWADFADTGLEQIRALATRLVSEGGSPSGAAADERAAFDAWVAEQYAPRPLLYLRAMDPAVSAWEAWQARAATPLRTVGAAGAPDEGLTDERIEFGLNNQMEDPSKDECFGFYSGARWAEAVLRGTSWPIMGGRESLEDALEVVESLGEGTAGVNDTFARQIILAAEIKRLRAEQSAIPLRSAGAAGALGDSEMLASPCAGDEGLLQQAAEALEFARRCLLPYGGNTDKLTAALAAIHAHREGPAATGPRKSSTTIRKSRIVVDTGASDSYARLSPSPAPAPLSTDEPWGIRDDEMGFLRTFKTQDARDQFYMVARSRYIKPVLFGPASKGSDTPAAQNTKE